MKYGKLVNNWIRLSDKKDENEFLPAHLELIETPVSKRPRLITYLIMLFLLLAIIISNVK